MIIILYLFISFIILFVMYKKHHEELEDHLSSYDLYLEKWLFWKYYVFVPLCWIIIIPLYFIWQLFEIIYKKLNKENEEN